MAGNLRLSVTALLEASSIANDVGARGFESSVNDCRNLGTVHCGARNGERASEHCDATDCESDGRSHQLIAHPIRLGTVYGVNTGRPAVIVDDPNGKRICSRIARALGELTSHPT